MLRVAFLGNSCCRGLRRFSTTTHVKDASAAALNERFEEYKEASAIQAPRNPVGVQLLSRSLHAQVFPNASLPSPEKKFVQIAKDHLDSHNLNPSHGSILPSTSFTLPPLQGANLAEHFHRIGLAEAEPWFSISKEFASQQILAKPSNWIIQSGWTKYDTADDGSVRAQRVEFPEEAALSFDVETLPAYGHSAVLACAASQSAWYAWISPWLLRETAEKAHLIPFGSQNVARVIIGHNISYDRARISEEYFLHGTRTRFIDTMSLHVAVSGISSNQRPDWMKHKKIQETKRKLEAVSKVLSLLEEESSAIEDEKTAEKRGNLENTLEKFEALLEDLQGDSTVRAPTGDQLPEVRWEDVTSVNSLKEVARLHCGIKIKKEIRDDFMTHTPEQILSGIENYLSYCADDVAITHAVYAKTLPAFTLRCPSPVSFAGMLNMGSSFLPVNEAWERYISESERTYRDIEIKVKNFLAQLAEAARDSSFEEFEDDPWLSQLDWTPKAVGKSRGWHGAITEISETAPSEPEETASNSANWFERFRLAPFSDASLSRIIPLLLSVSYDGNPVRFDKEIGWHYCIDGKQTRLPTANQRKVATLLGGRHARPALATKRMSGRPLDLLHAIANGDRSNPTAQKILDLAHECSKLKMTVIEKNPWLSQLDWGIKSPTKKRENPATSSKIYWPKWYWDAAKPKKGMKPGSLDITVRNRLAPILMRLQWLGHPIIYSRQHGWVFRVAPSTLDSFNTRSIALSFNQEEDSKLQTDVGAGFIFYKLPHKDGESANVGTPLSKTFMTHVEDGTLSGPGDMAREALSLNVQCSYWISARDRIMNQHVVWQDATRSLGFGEPETGKKWGMILPHMITMGTVTRRAMERTWLTASNAKSNRVGSELKAMVRAPPGYAIVGADVDSEELWISSCMGDAQFGLHGATALGWMTLEGTKAAGTDLHSKTASILRISREQAKVFNYSRIYGAGRRHAELLLLQANSSMPPQEAARLAGDLYTSTKGQSTGSDKFFGTKFWHGGTESYVFNKLEEIALSAKPQTPALDCGITDALSRDYLPSGNGQKSYMTSRINWVVQSSGVDYLHLLIVSMGYLCRTYDIKARFLLSVHDELRYLVKTEDQCRAALALQISNLWTRSLFAYRLGMDDLPEGVAFFSAVDVDHVLRKEVFMPCTTPSQPIPIPPGKILDIAQTLSATNGGSLWSDGRPMSSTLSEDQLVGSLDGYSPPDCLKHRSTSAGYLRSQATAELNEIEMLAKADGRATISSAPVKRRKSKARKAFVEEIGEKAALDLDQMLLDEGYNWPVIYNVLKTGKLPLVNRSHTTLRNQ